LKGVGGVKVNYNIYEISFEIKLYLDLKNRTSYFPKTQVIRYRGTPKNVT
jgi:hypothetical protein